MSMLKRLDGWLDRWAGIRRSKMEHSPTQPLGVVSSWECDVPLNFATPCDAYPVNAQIGDARLRTYAQAPGVYWAHGVQSVHFFRQHQALDIVHLQTRDPYPDPEEWRTWMVADPTHWIGLQEYATRIRGPRVLIGGLGLGMIVHILQDREDIREITIIERSPDVVQLIEPHLPRDPRRHIILDDFWTFIEQHPFPRRTYETVFVDLWRGPVLEQMSTVMERVQDVQRCYPWPACESLFFFFQDAVDIWRNSEPTKEAL